MTNLNPILQVESKNDTQNKDKFQMAIEKHAQNYVNQISDEVFNQNKLISQQLQRAKLINEIIDASKLPDFTEHIKIALKVLFEEGHNYSDNKETLKKIYYEFAKAKEILKNLDLDQPIEGNFQSLLKLSNESIQFLFDLAQKKYTEKQFLDCLSLFSLLTTLCPNDLDFLYRFGIAAQVCEKYQLALQAFEIVNSLEENIGAHLFASECLLKLDHKTQAKDQLQKAKEIIKAKNLEGDWNELLENFPQL